MAPARSTPGPHWNQAELIRLMRTCLTLFPLSSTGMKAQLCTMSESDSPNINWNLHVKLAIYGMMLFFLCGI